tara:strand:- start:1344 stop:1664 length:321 start_codon:yes stop_codon:yes gene_type:complete
MKITAKKATESEEEKINQQLKLVDGKFRKREALSIIDNLVNVKLNFHKLQRLSRIEGNVKDTCTFDNSRITELIDDRTQIKAFLKALETNDCNLKIDCIIHITLEE